jgi:hypothetical protein
VFARTRAYDGGAPPARRPCGTDAPKDDHNLRPNIWPGLTLAGGVVIAAVIALILLGGAGPGDGRLPSSTNPADTRLFPAQGHVAGESANRPPKRHRDGGQAPSGSAAEFEYGAEENRGVVLGGP